MGKGYSVLHSHCIISYFLQYMTNLEMELEKVKEESAKMVSA